MRTILFVLLSFLVLAPQAADAARRDERTAQASRPQAQARPAARTATRATAQRRPAAPPRAAALARSGQPTARAARSGQSARNSQVAVRRNDVRSRRGGTVVRGAAAATISRDFSNCTRRNGRAVCGGNRSLGWQAGLPAMTMEQQDCPVGTFATLARGHDDIVRCMPL